MQKRWVSWVVGIVAFVTIAIVAAVLIAYGVATHEEPGLLEVCRGVNGVAIYIDEVEGDTGGGNCADAAALRWRREDIPLGVRVTHGGAEGGAPSSEELRVVELAVADLNAQVGFELFRLDRGTGAPPAVALVLGAPAERGDPPGECRHWLRPDGFASSAAVVVRNVPDDATIFRVLLHELGHVAGLAHDDWTGSMMNRRTISADASELPPGRLSDSDRSDLRELYAPR